MTNQQKIFKIRETECKTCNGVGFSTEHNAPETHNPETGECINCPIQVQCEDCCGTGEINHQL